MRDNLDDLITACRDLSADVQVGRETDKETISRRLDELTWELIDVKEAMQSFLGKTS